MAWISIKEATTLGVTLVYLIAVAMASDSDPEPNGWDRVAGAVGVLAFAWVAILGNSWLRRRIP